MSRYTSDVKIINAAQAQVWARISDFSIYQQLKEQMTPEQKEAIKAKINEMGEGKVQMSNFVFSQDAVDFKVSGMDMRIYIVEREEPMKCVKFKADKAPIDMTLWIQLLPKAPYETKCKVTVEVDIPFFLKPIVGKKLDGVADQIAEFLTKIPY